MSETKQGLIKYPEDLEECEIGKEVALFFNDGSEYHGFFKGIDDDGEIILQALESEHQIGLPFDRLNIYIERTK